MIRRLLVALALLVGSAAVLTASADLTSGVAYAAPRCTASTGVVVAVDFSAWEGPTVRGCASTPTTGLQALHDSGFSTTGTAHDGPGFVCRIASGSFRGGSALPSTAQQACVRTPPSTAYWSYWHAGRAQYSWHYSSLGAAGYSPQPGSVDGWTFGAGTPPNVAPAALRATGAAPPTRSSTVPAPTSWPTSIPRRTSTPQPSVPVATIRVQPGPGRRSGIPPRRAARTGQADPSQKADTTTTAPADPGRSSAPKAPPASTTSATSGPQTSRTSVQRTASPSRGIKPGLTSQGTADPTRPSATTGTAPQKAGAASTSTTTAATPSATSTAGPSTSTVIDATSAAPAPHSGGSPWPALLGGALILLLAAGAALTFWRRRQLG